MKNKIENINLTKNEEQILFHTLGYSYEPYWNEKRREDRNFYGITPCESDEYKSLLSLVERGWMVKCNSTPWGEDVFSVTEKGNIFVVTEWEKKKKENKPSRSKRRYRAYFDWTECYASGTFKDFLLWLSPKEKDRILYPEEVKIVEEFKRRWNI